MGRKSDAKQRLLQTASQLFWQKNCTSVSVDQICNDAGVNKGSFYHFFSSKTEIILAVIEAAWEELRDKLLEPAFAPDISPLKRIERFFSQTEFMQIAGSESEGYIPGCRFCNLSSEMYALDPEVRERIVEIQNRQKFYLKNALQEASDAGDFSGDISQTASAVYSLFVGALLQAKVQNDIKPLRESKECIKLITGKASQQTLK